MTSTYSNPTDPRATALLVMDYQYGILGNYADSDELVSRTANAVKSARDAGVRIAFVRVAFTTQDCAEIPDRNKTFAGVAKGRYLGDGTPAATFHADLRPTDEDIVVTKTRFGAFSTTSLASQLEADGIDTLVLAGLSTSGVVLSTVRDASDRDFRIFVLSDCCSDPKPEVHRTLMEDVFPQQAEVLNASELTGLLGT
jgi:nicotinamidase-related amidase